MYCESKHVCWAHIHSLKIAVVVHSLQSNRQNSCTDSTDLSALSTFLYGSDFKLFEWVGKDFLTTPDKNLCFGRKSVLSTAVVLRLISLMPLTPGNREQFHYRHGHNSHLVLQ